MQDILTTLSQLHRPRLLMRAARIGAEDYQRRRHLSRILPTPHPERTSAILLALLEVEDLLNDQRLMADAAYNLTRHVEVLIAIVAEANELRDRLAA